MVCCFVLLPSWRSPFCCEAKSASGRHRFCLCYTGPRTVVGPLQQEFQAEALARGRLTTCSARFLKCGGCTPDDFTGRAQRGRGRGHPLKLTLQRSSRYSERKITLSKLRISVVQYLNTAPLVRGFTHGPLRGKYELSFTVPSQCAEALRTGAADVAIIPAIEYQRIVSDGIGLTILPGLAIASKERVRSLLIVSKVPIRQARRIALDRSSRSTQALTKILCALRWQIAPEFFEAAPPPLASTDNRAPHKGDDGGHGGSRNNGGTADNSLAAMLANADAALIIGDAALRIAIAAERHVTPGPDGEWLTSAAALLAGSADSPDSLVAAQHAAPAESRKPSAVSAAALSAATLPAAATLHIYDVVKEWWHLTEKPAVLAVWAARNDSFATGAASAVDPPEDGRYANNAVTAELAADFLASRDFGLRQIPEICAEAAEQMQLPEKELRLYLEKNIDYGLDEENLQGLLSFFQYSEALNLIGPLQPISIAAGPDSAARSLDFSGEWRAASSE
jgi:predicted solute-binding protein